MNGESKKDFKTNTEARLGKVHELPKISNLKSPYGIGASLLNRVQSIFLALALTLSAASASAGLFLPDTSNPETEVLHCQALAPDDQGPRLVDVIQFPNGETSFITGKPGTYSMRLAVHRDRSLRLGLRADRFMDFDEHGFPVYMLEFMSFTNIPVPDNSNVLSGDLLVSLDENSSGNTLLEHPGGNRIVLTQSEQGAVLELQLTTVFPGTGAPSNIMSFDIELACQ